MLLTELDITACVIRSALGDNFFDHQRRLVGAEKIASPQRSAGGGGSTSWLGVEYTPPQDSHQQWSEIVTRAVREAGLDLKRGIVVLGAAQYSVGVADPVANEHFGAPRSVDIYDDKTSTRIPLHTLSHACASVLYAVELAQTILADSEVTAVVIATASTPSLAAEESMRAVRALSATVARPFSSARDGITLGAGAGAIVLQRRGEAAGVPTLASVVGAATRIAAPTAASQGVEDVVDTLSRAHLPLRAEPLDVVIAHATGTKVGDPVELQALSHYFQDSTASVAVVSHKGITGHLLHASGIVGLCHAISLMGSSEIVGTWQLLEGVERGLLRVLPGGSVECPISAHPVPRPIRMVAVNALGFGGNTATVVLNVSRKT